MLRPAHLLVTAAAFAATVACGPPGGTGERGTTRLCVADDSSELDKTCYRQCADLAEPACTVTRSDDASVFECLKDGDGAYLMDDAGGLVPPAGETECYTVLTDDTRTAACMDAGANLEIGLFRSADAEVPEGACYDLNCATSEDAADDCPDLD